MAMRASYLSLCIADPNIKMAVYGIAAAAKLDVRGVPSSIRADRSFWWRPRDYLAWAFKGN